MGLGPAMPLRRREYISADQNALTLFQDQVIRRHLSCITPHAVPLIANT
ncbi:Protein of unknown function [Propionibacterium freudenreichii subsp. freudenreichii]|uniref:Uncharacterized protein n=1 Tax=Propionibacterium freudenreichii subsp. freudenreichii TaxID=66712 RepID=A0A0B7NZ51_PROFF|nr:Protein of unknown function [Propionibacterium freudenreichii]CEH05092.1 Protein of unknown function [Propionibacterium freudenreichii]CEH08030.1 Protein of unknown function [Propionibacterium freudenreichii]CEP26604.1 Protein of unknown function [Propionibacterium freudenreichii subsp. freudenreichii]